MPGQFSPSLGQLLLHRGFDLEVTGVAQLVKVGDRVKRGEHQEHRKQEQRHRRHEPRTLAVDVAPRQHAGSPRQQRQRVPDFPLKVEHAVRDVVEEGCDCPVDVPALAACTAIRPGQRDSAVEARVFVRMSVAFPSVRLYRARNHAVRNDLVSPRSSSITASGLSHTNMGWGLASGSSATTGYQSVRLEPDAGFALAPWHLGKPGGDRRYDLIDRLGIG